ncbi:MAG: mono/diheme cytochrome c family protein [Chitinophagales bacterium]|jgi:mono/diheme cytochrome c family protein
MSNRRKYAIIAVLGIIGFWVLTRTLNALAKSPGSTSYAYNCAKCHGKNGEGLGQLLPPLANTDWLQENMNQVPCIIRNGVKDSLLINSVWYHEEMLGIENLNDIQVANITNYVSKRFTEEQKYFSQDEIERILQKCK